MTTERRRKDDLAPTARRVLVAVGIVALALALWQIAQAFLLIFLGILLAVFVHGLAKIVSRNSPLPLNWALGATALVLVGILALVALMLGPRIVTETSKLAETLPESVEQLEETLQQLPGGAEMIDSMRKPGGELNLGGDLFSRFTGMASRAMSVFTNVILILFSALFFAADPELYKSGVAMLVPKDKTERIREVLDAIGHALWKWLLGKGISMLFVGVSVTVGMLLIDVPLPYALGVISGLSDFVPFIGPTVAAVPGILIALTISPTKALYAALLYFAVQQIEGNILTPLVQQEQVSIPPALILLAVVAAGLLFGLLGVIVATPLLVVIMVAVKMLYVEDALGKSVDIPGE